MPFALHLIEKWQINCFHDLDVCLFNVFRGGVQVHPSPEVSSRGGGLDVRHGMLHRKRERERQVVLQRRRNHPHHQQLFRPLRICRGEGNQFNESPLSLKDHFLKVLSLEFHVLKDHFFKFPFSIQGRPEARPPRQKRSDGRGRKVHVPLQRRRDVVRAHSL